MFKILRNIFGISDEKKKFSAIRNKHFSELVFTVIDLETSGLDTTKDKILSFGGIKVVNGAIQVEESLELVFKQKTETDNKSVIIHGLLKRDISGGDEKSEGLKTIRNFIGDTIIVGHHIDFDYLKLNDTLKKYFNEVLDNPRLDTAELAIRLEKGAFESNFSKGEFGLDELCSRYNIEVYDRHTAPGDAFITAQLLIKLFQIAEAKGLKTVGQLLEKRKSGLV